MCKHILLATTLLALAHAPAAFAQSHDHHNHAAPAAAASQQAPLPALQQAIAAIETGIGNHDQLHQAFDNAAAALKRLQAEASGDSKARLQGAAKQLSAQLGKLHGAIDKGDKAAIDVELKKTKAALKLVETHSGSHSGHGAGEHSSDTPENTLKLGVINPQPLGVGKPVTVTVSLADTAGKPVGFDGLKEAHTQRFHALIIDETLTDYHHVHPTPGKNSGEYSFTFTPNKPGDYRLWADVIPAASGKQEYIIADLKGSSPVSGKPDRAISSTATVEGLTFALSFQDALKTGNAAMGKVTITKDGKPFTQLEPVMGAFAHIVGFNEDRQTVAHIHPMGAEPKQAGDRGGPELSFHIEPEKAGFTKLFVQVRVGGKDIFAPLGITVN